MKVSEINFTLGHPIFKIKLRSSCGSNNNRCTFVFDFYVSRVVPEGLTVLAQSVGPNCNGGWVYAS